MGQGREDDCGLRKAEEDRALHPCHRRARACLHGLFGLRRQAADRFPRPGRALARGSFEILSHGLHAGGSRRGREHRTLLPLLVERLADEAERHRQPERLPLPLGAAISRRTSTQALSNDLQVMLTIRTAPAWAERGGHSPRGTHNPDPGYLKKFARAAAIHYKADVQIWGVWNEPNYKTFLSPQYKQGKLVSPAMYRKLLNAAASSIHGVDPTTGSLRARPPRSRTGTARASRRRLARCSSCASSSASIPPGIRRARRTCARTSSPRIRTPPATPSTTRSTRTTSPSATCPSGRR